MSALVDYSLAAIWLVVVWIAVAPLFAARRRPARHVWGELDSGDVMTAIRKERRP